MFSQETIEKAVQYTQSIRSTGKAVFPADTELGKIVETHIFPLIHTNQNLGGEEGIETVIKFLTQTHGDDASDTIDAEVSRIAEVIQNNIDLARKVALPIVNTTSELIDRRLLEMAEEMRNSISVSIGENTIYELLVNNATLYEIVKEANNKSYTEYGGGIRAFPEADYASILSMCQTGSSEFDNLLAEVFNRAGEQTVSYLYKFYMCQNHPRSMARALRTEELLVMYLLGYALCSNARGDNIPEGIDMPLAEFTRRVLEYRSVCRTGLKKFIDDYRFREKTGSLVYDHYRSEDGQLHLNVIPSVYNQAIERGITTDIIIGATLSDSGTWHLSNLIRERDNYMRVFITHQEKMTADLRKRRGDVVVSSINEAVNTVIANADIQIKNLNWGEIRNKLHSQINIADDADPVDIAIKFIMTHLFEGTLVPRIVKSMNELASQYPNETSEQLAARVVTMITVSHMLSRVKIITSGS